MGQILYGATVWASPSNGINFDSNIIGKNSEAFTSGDPCSATSGVIKVIAATTGLIIGVIAKTATMASTNQTVAKVRPAYIPVDQDYTWLMGTNSDLTGDATDIGTYYGLTGATGAVQVDVTSGVTTTTSRQVVIIKVDPLNIGGTGSGSGARQCLVKFVNLPNFRQG